MNIEKYNFTLLAMKQTRIRLLKIIDTHSIEEINRIPKGFNNNLIWNFVHTIVTQQLLCYSLSGLKPIISSDVIDAYRKGSKPGKDVDEQTLVAYKKMAFDTLDQFELDIEEGIFKEYKPYETSFGLTLNNFKEASHFNLAHETLHLGIMMSMRKVL